MLPSEGHVLLWLLVLPALLLAAPRASFRPIPLPTDFSSYDLNGDAAIDVSELANVSDTSEAQATKPFLSADTNHDGLINADEFHSAPWDLQGTLGATLGAPLDGGKDDEDDQDDYMDDEGRTSYTEDEDEEDKKDEDNLDEDEDDDDDGNNDEDDEDDEMEENEDRGIDGDDEDDDEDNSNQ